ncbi:MAG: acetylxylan esterase [Vicinamibacterales bacterium]
MPPTRWCAVVAIVVLCAPQPATQEADARQQLIAYLNGLATPRLEARRQAVAAITTRAAAERRRTEVRAQLLAKIGGVPDRTPNLQVKSFGRVAGDGFTMEKVAYESLPGFWVTANLYAPAAGAGRVPAIVLPPGHGPGGKSENWSWGANFARNGIVVLAYDPIGQGERLQYVNGDTPASMVGNPTGEHGEANIGPLLIGDSLARYMVNDAIRGIDYLVSRPDVDASRIGAFGCSGGGTATAFLAAVEPRLSAAATACYLTSFDALLTSATGVQEAEQSLPRFIAEGLDFPDWVDAFAPKPYAIVSTDDDMFPFAGARRTFEEAQRFYGLFDARDRVQWITGPGGHGNLGPIAPAILEFFVTHLKAAGGVAFTAIKADRPADMIVTPTGQVATTFHGETVASLNRARAASVIAAPATIASKADLTRLQTRLASDIRSLTGAARVPGASRVAVTLGVPEAKDGYQLSALTFPSDGATVVAGQLAVPQGPGKRPAALLMDSPSIDPLAPSPTPRATATGRLTGEVERLAKAGVLVLTIDPRPTPPGTESLKSPYLGIFNLLSLRAFLVGRTLLGLRVDDVVRAVDWLSARPDVGTITVHGVGPHGLVALHAAVLDRRIGRLVMEGTLTSYRRIVDEPLHREVSEVVIPGVLRRYDTADLLLATYPRPVRIIAPVDALGAPLTADAAEAGLTPVRTAEQKAGLGPGARIVVSLVDR